MEEFALGIDVGGTFTDIVLLNLSTGDCRLVKTPSTPEDPSRGFISGVSRILEQEGVSCSQVRRIFHGTTIATNAILEGTGTEVGVLVSEGFKYVLEIGRHNMARMANPHVWVKPERPVPPERVLEISERTSFDGSVIETMDEEAVIRAAGHFRDKGIESIAISLTHSYANPKHELRVRELVNEAFPDAHLSLSSEVLPVFREYERTITTVLNAYVMPRVSHYIENLDRELRRMGIEAPLLIMKSNGGVIGTETASRQPVHTALSGPAAGVMAAIDVSSNTGVQDCNSFDMGGTSTDVSLVNQRTPTVTLNAELGDWPVQLPMLDIATIGAGGGSIAWLTAANNLNVGPRSAGAVPGPVCYGAGGTEPTVTDANLILGRIDESIAGGSLTLDAEAARTAIRNRIAAPLGLDLNRAAHGILQIVNNNMVGAIRNVSVERGYDPRDFALVAFGGAGPMHAIAVARLLGMTTVIAPPNPGVASAYGLLVADFKNDYARTSIRKLPDYDADGMQSIYRDLEAEATNWLDSEAVSRDLQELARSADLRYAHQGFEVTVELAGVMVDEDSLEATIQRFHQEHHRLFGFSLDQPVEFVTLRVTARGHLEPAGRAIYSRSLEGPADASPGQREVFFEDAGGFVACDIYRRDRLVPGSTIGGPAILENVDSTVVIEPGWKARIDDYGNCILQPV
ncbi:MAG: hydantoinase/oxoprolinase family protein [Chloroflexi bacterium]|nr:hydantoinase/oxoprolinase family protein [Chloroflexota bacterium]